MITLYLLPLQYSRTRHTLTQPLFLPRQKTLSFILHSPLSPTHSPLVSPSLNTLSLPTRHSHPVGPNSVTNTLSSETRKFASPLCLPLRPVTIYDHHLHQVAYHSLVIQLLITATPHNHYVLQPLITLSHPYPFSNIGNVLNLV